MSTVDDILTDPTGQARRYLHNCFADAQGWVFAAIGTKPFRHPGGMYDHHAWNELAFWWPSDADRGLARLTQAADTGDIYICPYLMKSPWRSKGGAVRRAMIHADIDRDITESDVAPVGGFMVWSGTGRHAHVYVPLQQSVSAHEHEYLCRRLATTLGGDTAKHSDHDLLRLPGTWNYKSKVDGGAPSPVLLHGTTEHE